MRWNIEEEIIKRLEPFLDGLVKPDHDVIHNAMTHEYEAGL
jgi:hypothetical protein